MGCHSGGSGGSRVLLSCTGSTLLELEGVEGNVGGPSGFFLCVVGFGSPGSDRRPGVSLLSQLTGGHKGPTVEYNCWVDFPMGRSLPLGFEGGFSARCSGYEGGQSQLVSSVVRAFSFVRACIQLFVFHFGLPWLDLFCFSRVLPVAAGLHGVGESGCMGSVCSV